MNNKKIGSTSTYRNNSLCKSLLPIRSNNIRGSSVNHCPLANQMSNGHKNSSMIQPRVMNRPLTVFTLLSSIMSGKGIMSKPSGR